MFNHGKDVEKPGFAKRQFFEYLEFQFALANQCFFTISRKNRQISSMLYVKEQCKNEDKIIKT